MILESIINLLVGASVFIIGMNMMSTALKKASGKGLKNLLKKIQNNRFAGSFIGMIVTTLIQSSSATSVMVMGFVNAKIMPLFIGVSIIIGAYIGTSITGVLVSLSSFNISKYLIVLVFIGVILSFIKNEKAKNIGEILAGFGILFIGLEFMGQAFNGVDNPVNIFCKNLFTTLNNPFLLLLIGALFTALIQSSSATIGIIIVMVGSSAISLSNGFYLSIGATIGTVITMLIASIGGSKDVKRLSFVSLLITLISGLVAIAVIWPLEAILESFFINTFKTPQLALALFQVFYKVIFMGLMLGLINPLIKLSRLVIKDAKESDNDVIKFIDDRLLNTPSIALMQVKNEIINMMKLSYKNLELGFDKLVNKIDLNDKDIIKNEEDVDTINNKLTKFMISLSSKLSSDEENRLGSYFHVVNDIERIGDHAYNFYELANKMDEAEVNFSEISKQELINMMNVVNEMKALSVHVFESRNKNSLVNIDLLEEQVDELKKGLNFTHFNRIKENSEDLSFSQFYTTIVLELERIADHIVNIAYSIVNPTGDIL